ncbi:nicotinate-nucleotide--dimethylbenzimidazole phosphoribosyltransferase [Williamsia sterculiae]|uniref:Nicotinate-nucleotide--dimethylbenzimidazole phosphoribosyltransferase n=1 Tax=Williamsia sterculiae TaxID=1344003 RepID=A0A1N7GAV5_9NOCA|nr:nicotinate-nucleotide--dimethylbenzimidazole phosphoribosyltransferase [Williamsia sterculiae]SIS09662.1 adenosylcobinamide kinase /nicotinate-nucleotide-dimethylbenzimidazole phosphoribosyltransferase /adenosylcobinamide-phosphate guanylyltransferase [Williamsia sterculiae]
MRTLVLGGIRSGKSAYAESLVASDGPVRYLATATAPQTGDPDWTSRITTHRERRPSGWVTVETTDPAAELRAHPGSPTLLDDLGGWLTGHLDSTGGWETEHLDLRPQFDDLCAAVSGVSGDLVLVSSEVGLGLVAPTPVGRRYQDLLGELNSAVAAVCDRVVLLVAGRVLEMSDNGAPTPHRAPDVVHASAVSPVEASPPQSSTATSGTDEQTVASNGHRIGAEPIVYGDEPAGAASVVPTFGPVTPPSREHADAARDRQTRLTKPAGSLGRLEEISVWAASCQRTDPPAPFTAPTVVVFAGDHGVARRGVSAYPPEVTAQMVANIVAGGAAVNVFAEQTGATVRVEDLGVDAETPEAVRRFKVRHSSGDLRTEDALSADETARAVTAGRDIADDLIDSGVDLLIAGDMGIGNTTPAAVLIGTITDNEPVVVVGRGTGIDDATWIRKTAAIRDGMRRARPHVGDPQRLLQTVAGADIAAMAGFLAQAAARATPVILDGVVVGAAALVADALAPGARDWWLAGHLSAEPAHRIALDRLDLTPVLELSMRLGEGSGALTALPIVQSAVAALSRMATFDGAGVSTAGVTAADATTASH